MSAADPTIRERMARFREKQAKEGLQQVNIYVPKERVREIKEIAARMREEYTPHK